MVTFDKNTYIFMWIKLSNNLSSSFVFMEDCNYKIVSPGLKSSHGSKLCELYNFTFTGYANLSRGWTYNPRQMLKGFSCWNKHRTFISVLCNEFLKWDPIVLATWKSWEQAAWEAKSKRWQEAVRKESSPRAGRQWNGDRKVWWCFVSESSFTLFFLQCSTLTNKFSFL